MSLSTKKVPYDGVIFECRISETGGDNEGHFRAPEPCYTTLIDAVDAESGDDATREQLEGIAANMNWEY